jgi:dTDP-4-amino-4,6-dideoxygalactose transaminase
MSVSAAERHRSVLPPAEQYLEVGYNYRMTDLQAAVGLVQLGRLDAVVARRRELAARYREGLAGLPGLRCVEDPPHGDSNFQSFWVEVGRGCPVTREELLERLALADVSARRGIMAAHRQPAYHGTDHGPLPVTERLNDNTLILPLFHQLTESDQDRVIAVVRAAAGAPSSRDDSGMKPITAPTSSRR